MNKDPLSTRLLATFVGEIEEQVRTMNAELLALETEPRDAERLKSLFRVAHTLKGAARAAAVAPIEEACHALEALLADARDGKYTLGPDQFSLLFAAADALADAGKRLKAGQDLAGSPLAVLRGRLATPRSRHARKAAPIVSSADPIPSDHSRATPAGSEGRDGRVRVDAEQLDGLLAATGQLVIAGGRAATHPAELQALHDFVGRWATQWTHTGRRLRLALERSGAPSALRQEVSGMDQGVQHVFREAGRLAGAAGDDARTLSQVTAEITDRVRRLRMRPIAEACEVLPRMVRDLASIAGKDVELDVQGGEVEVDRAILDGLHDALVHLVRNAVDHGIEPPAERENAGKPRRGTVRVAATLRGDRVNLTVADDGAGLDAAAIRVQLERRGLPVPGGERELAHTLFEGGLSTRGEVTPISGRGVGLNIVRAAVERIRGTAGVTWEAGRGTTFTLECPPTLATIRALLVAVGPQVLAIPTTQVERLLRIRPGDIRHAEGREVIATIDAPVPLVALARLLPPLVARPEAGALFVVLLRAGERRLALVVDELLAEQEIVLRPVGTAGHPLPLISGAAILATGRVALVLDPAAIVGAGLRAGPGAGVESILAAAKPARPVRPRILVVDDSITTRTLEQSILEAAGYEVLTAVDGADGWKMLQEQGCDLVVADVEMPRMDGFTLCESIRASKRFKTLPVVVVTALETAEQRARGLEAGADAYLGKSSFDQKNLLDTISQLLG